MTREAPRTGEGAPERLPPITWAVLLLCFFLSGTAGLVYQILWTRQLVFVFGSSELAITAVLAAFLGGLGGGALLAGRYAERFRNPLRTYALLELAIGLSALGIPWGIQLVQKLYVALFSSSGTLPAAGGIATTAFHLLSTGLLLALPTACMGATLPILARWVVRSPRQIGPATGLLYATNTAGAVVGAPLAGFVLLPRLGLFRSLMVGVALSLSTAAISGILAWRRSRVAGHDRHEPRDVVVSEVESEDVRSTLVVALVLGSGMVTLVYEVLWTRLLSQLLGGSLQAFSTMLATFLAGIALGSAAAAPLARTRRAGVLGFAWAQTGIALTTALGYALVDRVPTTPLLEALGPLRDASLAALLLLPSTICIGATFPFAVRMLARAARDAGPASARVYGWSTLGSIAGAILAGHLLLPTLGFSGMLTLGLVMNLLLAGASAPGLGARPIPSLVAGLLALGLFLSPPATPWNVLRSGPLSAGPTKGRVTYQAVGHSSNVLLIQRGARWMLTTNGLPEGTISSAAAPPGGYQVTRWLGALGSLCRPHLETMLVVGLGAGGVLEGVPEGVRSIDVVELEPEVVRANRAVSELRDRDPLADPRVQLVENDARSVLLLSAKQYGIIVSQPSHPWTTASAHLYTRDFFELARSRLTSDGVLVQWVGLAFVDEPLLRSLLATLSDVFPNVAVVRPPTGAALLFVASAEPLSPGTFAPGGLESVAHLADLGIASWEDLAASRALDPPATREYSQGFPVITDDLNLLETRALRRLGYGLGHDLADAELAPWDPLVPEARPTVDRVALIRRLLELGHGARARRLAESTVDPSRRQTAMALLARTAGEADLARALSADALNRSPDSIESRALFLQLRRDQVDRESRIDPRLEPLNPLEEAVVEGWRRQRRGDLAAIAPLDEVLATAAPGSPWHEEAVRLRIAGRLNEPSPVKAEAALELLDGLLVRRQDPADLLLRARLALVAQEPLAALASLDDALPWIARSPDPSLRIRALRVLDATPAPSGSEEWVLSLRSRLSGSSPSSGPRLEG